MSNVEMALKAIEDATLVTSHGDNIKTLEYLDEAKTALTDTCDQGLRHLGIYSRMQHLLVQDGPHNAPDDVTLYFLMLIEAEKVAEKALNAETRKILKRSFQAIPTGTVTYPIRETTIVT